MAIENDEIDEPPPEETPRPRRARLKRLPPSPEQQGANREAQTEWMKEQFERIEREKDARINALREHPEHPSPICARLVKKFSGLGVAKTLIAKLLEMSYETLIKYYSDEIEMGKAEVTALVAGNMLRIAISEYDPNAARVGLAWLGRQGGQDWRQTPKENPDEGPVLRTIDSSKLSADQRVQLRDILTSLDSPPDEGGAEEPTVE